MNAYFSPVVDTSTEVFTFGKPDIPTLERLCVTHFDWKKDHAQNVLADLKSSLAAANVQPMLERWFTTEADSAKAGEIRSQRLATAVSSLRRKQKKPVSIETNLHT